MGRTIIWFATKIITVISFFAFLVSLMSVESDSWIPFVCLVASELWIIFYVLRDKDGENHV